MLVYGLFSADVGQLQGSCGRTSWKLDRITAAILRVNPDIGSIGRSRSACASRVSATPLGSVRHVTPIDASSATISPEGDSSAGNSISTGSRHPGSRGNKRQDYRSVKYS